MCSEKTMLALYLLLNAALGVQAQTFSNQAPALGITTGYGSGSFGGGVSFCDFNRDGLDDLTFASQNGDQVYFYQNNGNNSFSQLFLIDNSLQTKDVTWVDYDNDGDRDLFVTSFNGLDRLYQNQGGMNMVDVTQTAIPEMTSMKTMGAVWGDYNRDGWLDFYVCHYYFDTPNTENDLYLSNGNGTFTQVTATSPTNNGVKLTFDAIFVDVDENGWQDLYVVNDKYSTPNALYMNTSGSFTAAPERGADIAVDAMNAGGADYDDDGDFDFYVTNCVQGNLLFQNDGNAQFTDVAAQTWVGTYLACWGANFLDFDLDTDQDLYVSVQHGTIPNAMLENLADQGSPFYQQPLEFSGGLGGEDSGISYGNAVGDFNNDGLEDIAVVQVNNNSFRLWRNEEPSPGNWLKVDLFGTVSNTEGIGAKVEIDVNGKTLSRYRHGGQGYLSQNSARLHFGLGNATQIDEMRVVWPSGLIDVFQNISSVNQVFFVTEGEALPAELLSFSVSETRSNFRAHWVSAREVHLDYYDLERSYDGIRFINLQREPAQFPDGGTYAVDVQPGVSYPQYYRLKMVDEDGSSTYSRLLRVDADELQLDFQLGLPSPNPVSGTFQLPYTSAESGLAKLHVFSLAGRLVFEKELDLTAGSGQLILNTKDFGTSSQGVYRLNLLWQAKSYNVNVLVGR